MVAFAGARGVVEQVARDARGVARRVFGVRPSPLVRGALRSEAAPSVVRGRDEARALRVTRVVRETATAFTLVLTSEDDTPFAFVPGQFFTVLADVDGVALPRNYSASNAPGERELHLTIREKDGGLVSPRLARLAAGDTLRVLGPFGSFVVRKNASHRPLVLVAGGAGITPLMAMLRAELTRRPDLEVTLLYANRSADDVIFLDELAALASLHARLTVVHHVGALDRERAAAVLSRIGNDRDPRFFLCGPDGLREEVLAALANIGIEESSISIERFTIGPRPHAAPGASQTAGARAIAVRVGRRVQLTTALPGATLLEAGLAAGIDMPFSCAVGGCGACRVKLTSGDVDLDEPNCLTPREREAGYVLACVGRPLGPCSIEIE